MIFRLFYFPILFIFSSTIFGQVSSDKLRKPNLSDAFEKKVFEVNRKLDSTIFNTQIWISDEYPTQFDFDYGIIINKKTIQESISKFENVDLIFLIKLIVAHEKMHAKHFSRYPDWKREYVKNAHLEQLKLDEVKADIAAGYNAFDYIESGYVKYILKIGKHLEKKGFEKAPNFTSNELSLTRKTKADEVNAMKLFSELGDNQNQVAKYPNSYQRMTAIEYGMKAALIRDFARFLKNPKNNLKKNEKELLISCVEYYESQLDYFNTKYLNEEDFFYYDYLETLSFKITHLLSSFNKFITVQLLDGIDPNESGFSKFRMKFTNNNSYDSLKVFYSVLLCAKFNDPEFEYPNYTSLSAAHSVLVLAPKETKIVTDSLFDITQPLEGDAKFKVIFPGQFGSLYYVELLNNKNFSKYLAEKTLNIQDCNKCMSSVEELFKELHNIQTAFKNDDVEDYINGIGFQNMNTNYIEYSVFIKNRPFELLVSQDKSSIILKTTVYKNANINYSRDFFKSIFKKITSTNIKGVLKGDNIIELKNSKETTIGMFEFRYDDIFSEYQVELKLLK